LRLATLSDSGYLENPRLLELSLGKIRRVHKALTRKRFLSGNWFKQRLAGGAST
jgi:hypothetical protein